MHGTAIRAVAPHAPVRGIALRAGADGDGRTLFGHFAVVNQPTEIDSFIEGNFIERIAPGAFLRTFAEDRDQFRVMLQHGYDPELGEKPIASIQTLREDEIGAYYEATLLDGVPPLVVDGLRAGLYGASFRFRVTREDWTERPDPSELNPRGLPERTIREVELREFGPCTWGAYPDATANVRALDESDLYVTRVAAIAA
jgi:HK97 family phage prohead protease